MVIQSNIALSGFECFTSIQPFKNINVDVKKLNETSLELQILKLPWSSTLLHTSVQQFNILTPLWNNKVGRFSVPKFEGISHPRIPMFLGTNYLSAMSTPSCIVYLIIGYGRQTITKCWLACLYHPDNLQESDAQRIWWVIQTHTLDTSSDYQYSK